jgi:hypothetical protein
LKIVHHVGAEILLKVGDDLPRPALQQQHVLRDAIDQQTDLGQDQWIQQQNEQQQGEQHRDDHQQCRQATRHADPAQIGRRRVKHIGDHRRRHERRQH